MRSVLLLSVVAGLLSACGAPGRAQYQGYVEGEYVDVASSQAGRLQTLAVQRGDEVKAGAVLFTLEATLETAARQQAAQQLATAQAQYADLQTGKRPPEIAVVRAQLAQAVAAERNAAEQLRRDQEQFELHAISQVQLDNSRAQADSSSARVDELRNQLTVASLPGRAQQMAALAAQVNAARAQLDQANWRVTEKTVKAEHAGLIDDTLYRTGEWVMAGNPVVRMLPPANLKIRFFVPETVVGSLRRDQPVALHCDGCARDIAATIRYVSAQAEYTPPVIYSNDTRDKLVFMVEAWPTPADAALLHPGQPVAVSLK